MSLLHVKNILDKSIKITLPNNNDYVLSKNEDMCICEFNNDLYDYIYNYLKNGLEVYKTN